MEKAATYPTDAKHYRKSLLRLNKQCRIHGIVLRKSYTHTEKILTQRMECYAYAHQYLRMRKVPKQLKERLSRVVRDIERKTADWHALPAALQQELALSRRLLEQQPRDKNKLSSLHAPEVDCISNGKAHKRYEFGVKVGIVTALNRPFVLAAHALPNKPLDGNTLVCSLAHTRIDTGVPLKTVVVDKGYRGPQVGWPGMEIVRPEQRSRDVAHRRWRRGRLRRRSRVEALIGHMKNEEPMDRNWLKGSLGDAIRVLLCAAGQNLRLILRAPADFFAGAPSPTSTADQMHTGLQRFIEALSPYRHLLNARAQVNPLDEVIGHTFASA